MKEVAFKSLHISHLSHDDAVSLFRSTYELAIPVRAHIGSTADAILTRLITDTDACFGQVNRQRKSELSVTVRELRKTCNNLLSEIKRTIVFNVASRNDMLSKPGEELKFFFKPYWNMQKDAMPAQIEMTSLMLKKYPVDESLIAAARIIGVDTLMTELKTANTKLETIYLERNEEVGSRPPSGTNLRPPANESFMQFCTAIEQAARYTPNEELLNLFNQMLVLRSDAHRLVAGKKKEEKE
jgi:hypothetical protein